MNRINKIKHFFQNHILIFSTLGLIIGGFFTTLGFSYLLLDESNSLRESIDNIGDYAIWLAIIGLLVFVTSIFYFVATIINFRKFDKLINTHSKAKFIRNLDDIEKLAWKLTIKERRKVEMKRRKFRI